MDFLEKDPLAMDVDEKEKMDLSSDEPVITPLMPVIIEEINDNAISVINLDEFKETEPIYINDINNFNVVDNDMDIIQVDNEVDEINIERIPGNHLMTDEFLENITYAEYSSTLDNDGEFENIEMDMSRNDSSFMLRDKNKPHYVKKKRTLPIALQGLMGEANVRFAKGQIDLAAQMCFEIIRQVPSAPEPFQTLAMIYEHDQPQKSLQFALIAAHLNPKDADQWVHLANLSLESDNIKQAITCYSKAILASPKDVSLYEARAELQERMGDKKSAIRGLIKLITVLGPEDSNIIIKYAKILAKQFMQEDNFEQALCAMENVFNKCSDLVEPSDVNIMVEILIFLKQFHKCLEILTQYTDIWISYNTLPTVQTVVTPSEIKREVIPESVKYIESCVIPHNVPVDLKAKCLVALIELNELNIAEGLLPDLYHNENPEISGDLFLDVAEALMSKKQFVLALDLIQPLVHSSNFSLAAVWLRYAECWLGCGDISRAISSFEVVRRLSPGHTEARLELARLYEQQNSINDAINVLYQDPELIEYFDANVLFRRTQLLFTSARYHEYCDSALCLFSKHCIIVKTKAEITALTKATGLKMRLECLQKHRLSRGETLNDSNRVKFKETGGPTFEEEFRLFLHVCNVAYKLKRFGFLQKMCFSALTSSVFDCKSAYLLFLCIISCIYVDDTYHGFNIIREVVRSDPKSNYWNLLNVIIQRSEDARHNKFLIRLLLREDSFSYLHILHANNCLVAGTYKYALSDYVSMFKNTPNALLAFLISVTQLQIACQKFASRKNQAVVQAIAFLQKYAEFRGTGSKQETNYNLGRAFHQLGLIPAARHYYKQVLSQPTPKLVKDNYEILDLKREAAFNLHLIYLQSDSRHLASMYLQNYIIV